MKINKLVISSQFSDSPGARYKTDGDFSGEEFYEKLLKPQLERVWDQESEIVFIDFDNTFGYASSFISEVFLRVVKDFKDKEKIRRKIEIKSEDDPFLKQAIDQVIDES